MKKITKHATVHFIQSFNKNGKIWLFIKYTNKLYRYGEERSTFWKISFGTKRYYVKCKRIRNVSNFYDGILFLYLSNQMENH